MPDGTLIEKYRLVSGEYTAEITTLGAAIVSLTVPDRDGCKRNVVAGFSSGEDYLLTNGCYGAVIGRVCNRVGNASFALDGKTYFLDKNEGQNCLHSGEANFAYRVWHAEVLHDDNPAVSFTLVSPDGDGGYPGQLSVNAVYTLYDSGKLTFRLTAVSDRKTPVNLTNHAYFNLAGAKNGTVEDHILQLNADNITPTDDGLIPTGEILPVDGTPYDFRAPKPIGRDIGGDENLIRLGGYDHNFLINKETAEAAVLYAHESGIEMRIVTDQPSLQLYTANSERPDLPMYQNGSKAVPHDSVCLEAQAMPDAVHHPEIHDIMLPAGKRYEKTIEFCFSVKE